MQTLNLLEQQFSDFNAFRLFESNHLENNQLGLALLEQLQTTLDLNELLNKFAMMASRYVEFSGLSFKAESVEASIRGSRSGKISRHFNLSLNGQHLGRLVYGLNTPLSGSNEKILNELHRYFLNPLNNALTYRTALMLAMQDSLTGLGNRRYFDEQIKRAMHQANRSHNQVGLIVADLNKFKAINDTYGHAVGDKVLVHFADALRVSVRDSDSLFRFGGDEFVVLIECAGKESLEVIYHRIHDAVAADGYLEKYQVSCSLGATFMNRADTEKSFFERADQALYRKKMNMAPRLSLV
ncbi:GGDEF domain-containing protein [Thalassotalea euphylliae]|uniref:diguanylate cyclase n=1 Tax=Thalassotalea euphylliae TaxID=1655234 RepID=A0A3E0U6P4_9GAMM|nr:GGDEF domain-containing protein [Thalassotalea euphylliae]REL32479.1 GGDEF domain-containing protein [Thalassotalea euphylliae]REL36046.1 GGDEF domain-containing protein [Thalassotalea euphylliae]